MSGGGQKAPTPYQPPNQAGAASGFQQGAGQLAGAGKQLYGSVAPQLAGIAQGVQNNPYFGMALTGAQDAAGMASGTVAPQQFAGAAQDAGIANLAALAGPQYANAATQGGVQGYNQAQSLMQPATQGLSVAPGVFNQDQAAIPGATAGAGYAAPVLGALATGGGQTYGADMQALANLGTTGLTAADAVLNTGFDPQQQLYNRQYQLQQEQTGANAAQNGVLGSPYAAGIANQASTNFNIDWQNNELQRQIAALGAYNSAASTYAGDTSQLASGAIGNLATGLNSGTADYNNFINSAVGNLTNLQTTGVNNFNNLTSGAVGNATNLIGAGSGALNSGINTATGALGTLGNQAIAGNEAASQLGTQGLNTLAGAAQLPYDLFLQQQQAALAALGSQVTGTNASLLPTQQATSDYGNYLNIGQTASQGAIQAAQVNNQQSNAMSAGFGNLFGDVAGMFSFAL